MTVSLGGTTCAIIYKNDGQAENRMEWNVERVTCCLHPTVGLVIINEMACKVG